MAFPVVDADYLKEIEKARRHLRALISSRNCAPLMLRLAWHDAGAYDAKLKTGGPNVSIRNEEEYSHGSNNGWKKAIVFCEGVKSKLPRITYADPVEVSGGPTIAFVPGRKVYRDVLQEKRLFKYDCFSMTLRSFPQDSKISPKEGRLPDAKQAASAPHLRDIFYPMGVSDNDIVALSGGHTLGSAQPQISGFDGPWIGNTEDEDAFFRDFAESHKKLSELGFTPSSSSSKANIDDGVVLAQSAVGVVVAAAVVIRSYLLQSGQQ